MRLEGAGDTALWFDQQQIARRRRFKKNIKRVKNLAGDLGPMDFAHKEMLADYNTDREVCDEIAQLYKTGYYLNQHLEPLEEAFNQNSKSAPISVEQLCTNPHLEPWRDANALDMSFDKVKITMAKKWYFSKQYTSI